MGYAEAIGRNYARRLGGSYVEDLVQSAYLGLISADRSFAACTGDVLGFVRMKCRDEIIDFFKTLSLFSHSRYGWKKLKRIGRETILSQYVPDESFEDLSFSKIEVREVMEQICETNMDARIVILRYQGHSDRDIAELLGITDRTIRRRMERVRQKFLDLFPELDQPCNSVVGRE